MRVQGRTKLAGAVVLACVLAARSARASDAEIDARSAYDRGLVAHERGDELEAAQDFAEADRLQPSSAALEAAISSAIRAGDSVLVMQLVERARGRELDASAKATVARGRSTSEARVVRIVVDCGHAVRCTVSIDGAASENADRPVFALPARHDVSVDRDGTVDASVTNARGGETVRIADPHAAPPPHAWTSPYATPNAPPADSEDGAWKKPVAYAAIGASLVLAGVAVGSAVDYAAKRSDFNRDHCGADAPASTLPAADCQSLADAGKSAQTRTNVLVVGAAAVTAATVAFVIVAAPFASRTDLRMTASVGGASLALRFP